MKNIFWFFAFALSAILIGLYPILYFIVDKNFGLLQTKDTVLLQNVSWNIGFYTHIIFGGFALLIGWSQFLEKWQKNKPAIHKQVGKLYILFVFLSSISGIYIGFFATGGIIASLGFISLGIIWLVSTFLAYYFIKQRNFVLHRKFMNFSYAACFAAVTLRIWLPLLLFVFADFYVAYKIVAWLCWIPNLAMAYFINQKNDNRLFIRDRMYIIIILASG